MSDNDIYESSRVYPLHGITHGWTLLAYRFLSSSKNIYDNSRAYPQRVITHGWTLSRNSIWVCYWCYLHYHLGFISMNVNAVFVICIVWEILSCILHKRWSSSWHLFDTNDHHILAAVHYKTQTYWTTLCVFYLFLNLTQRLFFSFFY